MAVIKNILCLFLLVLGSQLFSLEKLMIPRADLSPIEAYFTATSTDQSYPLIILIQGSDAESVIGNHTVLANRFNPHGIAVLSVEKRGIHGDSKDNQEFKEHDFFEDRFQEYSTVMYAIEHGLLQSWNGDLILLGGSEGGKIAPRLALKYPSHIRGIILVGAGGGIPFGEELKFQIEASLNNLNPFYKICFKIKDMILPTKIDAKYLQILEQPSSLEMWYEKTFRWWASYLKYDPLPDLLQINVPIYMIHGALDAKIPIQSADAVKAAFDEIEKHNLTYVRYADLEHSLKGRDDVYQPLIEWICNIRSFPQGHPQ